MVGIPGAGKTQFADKFADTFSAPYVNYHNLQPLSGDDDAIHTATLGILKQVMKSSQTIVYEGETDRRVERTELVRLAHQNGYQVIFVWVQTDPHTAKVRSKKQTSDHNFEARMRTFSPPHESEPYVVISGKHTYSTQARMVLKKLTEGGRSKVDPVKQSRGDSIVSPRRTISRANNS